MGADSPPDTSATAKPPADVSNDAAGLVICWGKPLVSGLCSAGLLLHKAGYVGYKKA